MKSQNQKMFMKKSNNEGKLVSGYLSIIDVILKKVAVKIDKDLKRPIHKEKGLALLNQIGSMVGHSVTDKKQDNGKLFLKFGEEIVGEACWVGYKQKGMKKKGDKMVPNCVPEEMDEARNYRKEYDNYQSRPEQKLRRAARNAARRTFKDVPEDKDVHHKDNNPLNNDKSNLSVVTQKYNRTEPRLRERKLKEWLNAVEDVELNNLLQQEANSVGIQKALKKVKGLSKKQTEFLMTLPQPALMQIVQQLSGLVMSEVKEYMNTFEEEMGTVTGTGIAGTGDDSSTVVVRKKKRVLKRIRDMADYNRKGGHAK